MTDKFFSIGIDPAGIGTTGIVIKTYNGFWPQKLMTNIKATSAVDAASEIFDWIEKKKQSLENKDFYLKEVVVELPHGGNEKFKEVKATRELVGILRFFYREKFRGHLPNHKDKKLLESWKNDKRTSHVRDAEAILLAHINEYKTGFRCENAWGQNVTKKN